MKLTRADFAEFSATNRWCKKSGTDSSQETSIDCLFCPKILCFAVDHLKQYFTAESCRPVHQAFHFETRGCTSTHVEQANMSPLVSTPHLRVPYSKLSVSVSVSVFVCLSLRLSVFTNSCGTCSIQTIGTSLQIWCVQYPRWVGVLWLCCWWCCLLHSGNVWIYRQYGKINRDDPTDPSYCEPLLYDFAFWITTTAYIIIATACCCFVCCACLASCFGDWLQAWFQPRNIIRKYTV